MEKQDTLSPVQEATALEKKTAEQWKRLNDWAIAEGSKLLEELKQKNIFDKASPAVRDIAEKNWISGFATGVHRGFNLGYKTGQAFEEAKGKPTPKEVEEAGQERLPTL